MPRRTSPVLLRQQLGDELRGHREALGLRAGDVAKELGMNPSVLSRLENGLRRPVLVYVTALCERYGLGRETTDRLKRLAQAAYHDGWWVRWGVSDQPVEFVGLEAGADAELTYEPSFIPGLLQTKEYAESVTTALGLGDTDEAVRQFVDFRMERQQVLRSEDPLRLHAIINEAALRISTGEPGIRRRQLEHLIECAALPNVTLQVLRFDANSGAAPISAFIILEFAPDMAKDMVLAENLLGALYERKEAEVGRVKALFADLASAADGEQRTVAFIEELLRENG